MAAAPPPSSTGSAKLDGAVQKTLANGPEKLSGFALYSRFALAGAVCCSVTHGGLTPVDVSVVIRKSIIAVADSPRSQRQDTDTARPSDLQPRYDWWIPSSHR